MIWQRRYHMRLIVRVCPVAFSTRASAPFAPLLNPHSEGTRILEAMPLKVIAVERLEEVMTKVDSALQYHLDEF